MILCDVRFSEHQERLMHVESDRATERAKFTADEEAQQLWFTLTSYG